MKKLVHFFFPHSDKKPTYTIKILDFDCMCVYSNDTFIEKIKKYSKLRKQINYLKKNERYLINLLQHDIIEDENK